MSCELPVIHGVIPPGGWSSPPVPYEVPPYTRLVPGRTRAPYLGSDHLTRDRTRSDVTLSVWMALSACFPNRLYMRGPNLVVVTASPGGAPEVEELTPAALLATMNRVISAYEENGNARDWYMPDALAVRADAPLYCPVLETISEVPVFDPAGGIRWAGYHSDIKTLVLWNRPLLSLPDTFAAKQEIQRGLMDFGFADQASAAHAFALMQAPLYVRVTLRCPMFLILAADVGAGKSLLTELPGLIATGRTARVGGIPRQKGEAAYHLATQLDTPDPILTFDNVDGGFESDLLCRITTADGTTARRIGSSQSVNLSVNRKIIIVNGVNLEAEDGIARRSLRIELVLKSSHIAPSSEAFRHWVVAHRTEIISLFLWTGHFWFSGLQPAETPTLPSFVEWTRIVGGVTSTWLEGGKAFLAQPSRRKASESDMDELVTRWPVANGAFVEQNCSQISILINAMGLTALGEQYDSPRKLGKFLKNLKGREVFAGHVFRSKARSGAHVYVPEPVPAPVVVAVDTQSEPTEE